MKTTKATSAQPGWYFTPIILFIGLVLALGVATRAMAADDGATTRATGAVPVAAAASPVAATR